MEELPKTPTEGSENDLGLKDSEVSDVKLVGGESKRGVTFIRFLVWLSPSPACWGMLALIDRYVRPSAIFALLLCSFMAFLIGVGEALLYSSLPKDSRKSSKWRVAVTKGFVFMAIQFVLTPLVVFALGLGACALIVVFNA